MTGWFIFKKGLGLRSILPLCLFLSDLSNLRMGSSDTIWAESDYVCTFSMHMTVPQWDGRGRTSDLQIPPLEFFSTSRVDRSNVSPLVAEYFQQTVRVPDKDPSRGILAYTGGSMLVEGAGSHAVPRNDDNLLRRLLFLR
jgi:hypothetical protein